MEQATVAKSQVEDAQREQRRHMEESGMKHEPRFFELENGRWAPKLKYDFSLSKLPQKMSEFFFSVPKDPQEATKAVQEWIFPSTSKPGSISRSASAELGAT